MFQVSYVTYPMHMQLKCFEIGVDKWLLALKGHNGHSKYPEATSTLVTNKATRMMAAHVTHI